jgi:hypothetical protein
MVHRRCIWCTGKGPGGLVSIYYLTLSRGQALVNYYRQLNVFDSTL